MVSPSAPLAHPPPDRPEEVRLIVPGVAVALVQPRARAWLAELLAGGRGVATTVAGTPGSRLFRGRGMATLFRSPIPGEEWVVRPLRRGGMMAPLLGDRYLRTLAAPRPFREWAVARDARARGIRTPEIVAAIVRSAGPLFTRGEVLTVFLGEGETLADRLFPADASPPDTAEILRRAGEALRDVTDAGLLHPDLNARNIFLRSSPEGEELHVLDLDRARLRDRALSPAEAGRILDRLDRSLGRIGATRGRPIPAADLAALREGWHR